jgi:hypothetical protein
MTPLHCKLCLEEIHPGRGDYHLVRIDAVADTQPPIITQEELNQDVGAETERLMRSTKGMSEQQLQRQVYRKKVIYLCLSCFNRWIENPLSP